MLVAYMKIKGQNQLSTYNAADLRLCKFPYMYMYIDSTIPLLPRSENLSLDFCGCAARFVWDLVRNMKTSFLAT